MVQGAVEGLLLVNPDCFSLAADLHQERRMTLTLEVASSIWCVASECDLGDLFAQQVSNLLVGHVTHLVVVLEDVAHLVADATVS